MRLTGTVVSWYPSQGKYGGGFGEILGDDGKDYVYASGNVYRNYSSVFVGAKVSFEVAEFSYASHIDQLDKHLKRKTSGL